MATLMLENGVRMSEMGKIQLQVSEDDEDVAYLRLSGHPGTVRGVVKRTVALRKVLGDYSGPDLNLDFDENNVLIGVEILGRSKQCLEAETGHRPSPGSLSGGGRSSCGGEGPAGAASTHER
jgi:hypothetical protein